VFVVQEILNQYPNKHNKLFSYRFTDFFLKAGNLPFVKTDDQFRFGISCNLLSTGIDKLGLLDVIASSSDILFDFFGAYESKTLIFAARMLKKIQILLMHSSQHII
jgi:hypothetical protein